MKKWLNDLKRSGPLWIVGQSGEKLTMPVSPAVLVSRRPVIETKHYIMFLADKPADVKGLFFLHCLNSNKATAFYHARS